MKFKFNWKSCILSNIPVLVVTVLSDYFVESPVNFRKLESREHLDPDGDVILTLDLGVVQGEKEGLFSLVS